MLDSCQLGQHEILGLHFQVFSGGFWVASRRFISFIVLVNT